MTILDPGPLAVVASWSSRVDTSALPRSPLRVSALDLRVGDVYVEAPPADVVGAPAHGHDWLVTATYRCQWVGMDSGEVTLTTLRVEPLTREPGTSMREQERTLLRPDEVFDVVCRHDLPARTTTDRGVRVEATGWSLAAVVARTCTCAAERSRARARTHGVTGPDLDPDTTTHHVAFAKWTTSCCGLSAGEAQETGGVVRDPALATCPGADVWAIADDPTVPVEAPF